MVVTMVKVRQMRVRVHQLGVPIAVSVPPLHYLDLMIVFVMAVVVGMLVLVLHAAAVPESQL